METGVEIGFVNGGLKDEKPRRRQRDRAICVLSATSLFDCAQWFAPNVVHGKWMHHMNVLNAVCFENVVEFSFAGVWIFSREFLETSELVAHLNRFATCADEFGGHMGLVQRPTGVDVLCCKDQDEQASQHFPVS